MDVVILKGRHLWMYWLCIWGSSLPAIVATILAVENALELEFFYIELNELEVERKLSIHLCISEA